MTERLGTAGTEAGRQGADGAGQEGSATQRKAKQDRGRARVLVLFPSPSLPLWVVLTFSSSFGWSCFSPSSCGALLLSALRLLAGTAPTLPSWSRLSLPPSPWDCCCSGASAHDLSFRFVCFPFNVHVCGLFFRVIFLFVFPVLFCILFIFLEKEGGGSTRNVFTRKVAREKGNPPPLPVPNPNSSAASFCLRTTLCSLSELPQRWHMVHLIWNQHKRESHRQQPVLRQVRARVQIGEKAVEPCL